MRRFNSLVFALFCAKLLTNPAFAAAKIDIPPCPLGTERLFLPDASKPLWAACRDEYAVFQGLLIQFSGQTEIIRIAGIKNSEREGRELRFGQNGFIEERTFHNGHLNGKSFIFKSLATVGRYIPKKTTAQDWDKFLNPPKDSILKPWINEEPYSTIDFTDGRMTKIKFETKEYDFTTSKDGRMWAQNHPEMKKKFFIDPEPLWYLNAADLKAALLPGFGSCKKYDGPIGRFTRNYDHLLFKREESESKQLNIFNEIRDRFISFCVPKDITEHLGKLECPPALPSEGTPNECRIPISDQLRIPYNPKYFAFEFTVGHSPEEFYLFLKEKGLPKLASRYSFADEQLNVSPRVVIYLRKNAQGILFKAFQKDKTGKFISNQGDPTDIKRWWEWHKTPGF